MPSRSVLGAQNLTLASADGDDDDDFQDPGAATAAAQNLVLSTPALRLSNASRCRKRPKVAAAPGKENRTESRPPRSKSGDLKASVEKTRVPAAPRGSGQVKFPLASVSSSLVSSERDKIEEKRGYLMELESRVEENGDVGGKTTRNSEISGGFGADFSSEDGSGEKKLCHLAPNGSNSVENGCDLEVGFQISEGRGDSEKSEVKRGSYCSMSVEEMSSCGALNGSDSVEKGCKLEADSEFSEGCVGSEKLKVEKVSFYSMSIESRLLESIRRTVPSRVEVGSLSEVGGGEDFEPGTQLKELMNLCTEYREEEDSDAGVGLWERSNFGTKASRLESSGSIECPMCGKDITDLSEELRHDHTNDCLEESGNCYSVSSGSRLSGLRTDSVSRIGNGSVEADGCGESKRDMGLDMSMNIRSEAAVEDVPGDMVTLSEGNQLDVNAIALDSNDFVECPLCGTDISRLTEGLRQLHTNECLDKEEPAKVAVPNDASGNDSHQQVVNVNPVLGWLQTLGLSKYEDAFVREEVDWETLQCLTEEDLIRIGVVALGPRKKIVHALNELQKRNKHPQTINIHVSDTAVRDNKQQAVAMNKLITEYFRGPVNINGVCNNSRQLHGMEKGNKDSVRIRPDTRNHVSKRKLRDIPPWCSIPGTAFRVDAFRYLRGDCSHWFLTHFHTDHYQGLTRNFSHGKIYCSSITAHLVNMKIGVPWDRLHILPLNQKISIAGVNLTCLDANHCPGSIIILFEPPNGKAVLHTGDFRFSEEMASNSILQSCHVHTLILDTTYCNPQYDFPKQEAVIQFVIEAIQAEAFNPKTLFLIGSYTIGKEKLFLEVARFLRKKVYVGAAKLRLLSCFGFSEEDMQWFTANEMESQIHVVPMWTLASFKRMKQMSNQYLGRFNLIVAFSPTGWTFGKGKKKTPGRRWQQGTIIRYEVPYSEHCSFAELKDFVQFVCPEHIIPSVNNEGPESVDAMIALLMSEA